VRLLFADALDKITAVVIPGRFDLKRNKARPLLMMYSIGMTVLSDSLSPALVDSLSIPGVSEATAVLGRNSLLSSIVRLQEKGAKLRSFIDTRVATPLRNFVALSTGYFQRVVDNIDAVRGVVSDETAQLVGIAADLAMVGRNAFYTYNALVSSAQGVQHDIAEIANAYENALCVLRNAIRRGRLNPDYSDVYGASTCSSTIGGSPVSPLAGSNPFEFIFPTVIAPPAVPVLVKASIDVMHATDPVLRPMPLEALGAELVVITNGLARV
jgi:hypothetical protein